MSSNQKALLSYGGEYKVYNQNVYHLDEKLVFLNGDLDENIHVM